jgi:hypothetical protein
MTQPEAFNTGRFDETGSRSEMPVSPTEAHFPAREGQVEQLTVH